MKTLTFTLAVLALAVPLTTLGAEIPAAQDDVLDMFDQEEEDEGVQLELHGEMLNLFFWRNDSDFDATQPYYNAEGQSVGNISTFFKPQLTLKPTRAISLYYEAELGLNFWSRNNPDQWFAGSDDYMAFKHREIYSEFDMDLLKLKVGYQRLLDPSDLFLSHWMGAATLQAGVGNIGLRLFVGQLPDETYEGLVSDRDNFVHDNITWGLDGHMKLLDGGLKLQAGLVGVHDHRVARKHLVLYTPFVGGTLAMGDLKAELFFLGQLGVWENSGVDGIHQNIAAWATSGTLSYATDYVDIRLNLMALSPDDRYDGNKQWGAFFYSGKNHSASLMLTEDDLRDRYGNYDEQMSSTWGSFFTNRAGLFITDLSVKGKGLGAFQPELVVAGGFTLRKENSNNNSFVGLETDLILRVAFVEKANGLLVGQVFFPGEAGAAYVNHTDLQATEPVYGVQLGTEVRF